MHALEAKERGQLRLSSRSIQESAPTGGVDGTADANRRVRQLGLPLHLRLHPEEIEGREQGSPKTRENDRDSEVSQLRPLRGQPEGGQQMETGHKVPTSQGAGAQGLHESGTQKPAVFAQR